MIKFLKQYKLLIIIALLTIFLLLGLGYLFAQYQSKPTFATKIDRIMFERKNRSPKFVITLPDASQRKSLVKKEVTDFQVLPGNGLMGTLDGKKLFGGNLKFILSKVNMENELQKQIQLQAEKLAEEGKTPFLFLFYK